MPRMIQPIFQAVDVDDCEPRRNEIRASIKKARFRDEETFFLSWMRWLEAGRGGDATTRIREFHAQLAFTSSGT